MIYNKALKATFWYVISSFFLKGLSFITAPIFSRILTKAEFGTIANYFAWQQIIGIIITLSLLPSLIRGRFDYEKELNSFIASNLILGSLATLFSILFILLNSDFFSMLFVLEKKYIVTMILTLLVSPAYEMFMDMQRYKYKYKLVTTITIVTSLFSIGISLFLILIMKDRILARILGSIIPSTIVSVSIYFYYILHCTKIKLEYWKYSLSICIPYIFHLLSGTILHRSDRAMITYICGTENTALYSMAYNIALVVSILWSSMNSAFAPWLGEKLHSNSYASIRVFTRGYLCVFAILITWLMLIAPEILLFLGGNKYIEAKYVIPPVIAGCYFIFVYSLYVNIEQFENNTKYMAVATFLTAFVNVISNWIFIPIYGYIAAAYTTLVCYILLMIFHYFIVCKMGLSTVYDTKFILIISINVLLIMLLSLCLYKNDALFRYAILLTYGISLFYVGMRKKKEILGYFGFI